MNIFRQNIRVWMEYGTGVETPITRVEVTSVIVTYGLRELPVATVQIGHGRDILSKKRYPDTDVVLAPDIPAKIWCRLTGDRDRDSRWDGADRLLFDGVITSTAASRISNSTTGTYMVQHWSSALTGASLLASYTYPGNSVELILPAFVRRVASAGTGADQSKSLHSLLDQNVIYTDGNVLKQDADLWADIAKPFLIRVSKQNPFSDFGKFKSCFPNAGGDNIEALAALAKFEGESKTEIASPYNLAKDKWGVPVQLPGEANTTLRTSVMSVLTRPVVANLMRHTAWSYIIEHVCNDFGLYLVPGIDRCRVVPIAPTLNQVFKEFGPTECAVLDCNRPIDHYLKAVTMSAADITSAGQVVPTGPGSPSGISAFGPCYSPAAAGERGMVLPVEPPKWLRNAKFSAYDPVKTSRVLDGVAGGLYGANKDQADPNDVDLAAKAAQLRGDINKYGQDWVKSLYAEATTITRVMKLVSRFRLDVGPGSQILVSDARGVPGFGDKVYGMVSKVTIVVDGTRPMAATTYQVANLRDENENRLDFLGVERHPLFNECFVGSPLSAVFE
jgi:hypothetical protein